MSKREDRLWHVTTSPGSMRNWWIDNHGNSINAAGDIINRYCNCQGCLEETSEQRPKPQREQKMEMFAQHGAVYFVPDNTKPELVTIDLIFEREPPGLLFYRPATMRSAVIVEAIEKLPELCAQYVEQMKQVEKARA